MTDRLKVTLLVGSTAVWLGLLAVQFLTTPDPQRVPLKYRTGQRVGQVAASSAVSAPRIVHPEPRRSTEGAVTTPVNIFAPLGTASPVAGPRLAAGATRQAHARPTAIRPQATVTDQLFGPERPPAAAVPSPPPSPTPEELAAQQARQQHEAAAQQARQRLGQYRFLGYLAEGGEHRAFLGKGRELYIVSTGETLEGRVRVSAIDGASVKLTDAETGVGTTLPLVKDANGPS